MNHGILAGVAGAALLLSLPAFSQRPACPANCVPQRNSSYVDAEGNAHVTRVVPVPSTVSPQAQKLIGSNFANVPAKGRSAHRPHKTPAQRLAAGRSQADASEQRLGKQALAFFPANVSRGVIAGVPVRIIKPKHPQPSNADKVLINLHGGGFVADWGSLTETIPIASLTGVKVIAVLYRLAPEHPFPAAVDDAVAVYRELLKTYKPGNIGIYGTSAGAILTAETASRLRQLGLPLPAALGIFSGSGDFAHRGDSESIFSLTGLAGPLPPPKGLPFPEYVGKANRRDPVLSPIYADLRGFPPTLFISSTRDLLLSDTALLQRAFLKAGVPTRFVVFEALQHGFWNDPNLPESREADHTMANFFLHHLGQSSPRPARPRVATARSYQIERLSSRPKFAKEGRAFPLAVPPTLLRYPDTRLVIPTGVREANSSGGTRISSFVYTYAGFALANNRLRRLLFHHLNRARRHKPLHGRHRASLPAQVVHLRVPALRRVPGKKRKTLPRLALVKTRNSAQQRHPPVVGHTLFLAADVAGKRYIPRHNYTLGIAPSGFLDGGLPANTLAQNPRISAGKSRLSSGEPTPPSEWLSKCPLRQ